MSVGELPVCMLRVVWGCPRCTEPGGAGTLGCTLQRDDSTLLYEIREGIAIILQNFFAVASHSTCPRTAIRSLTSSTAKLSPVFLRSAARRHERDRNTSAEIPSIGGHS